MTWSPPASGGGGGSGTITEITSVDSTVTVTDPDGPVTDLSVTGGSVPANWLMANAAIQTTLTDISAVVAWAVQNDSGAGYFELNADTENWDCLVDGQYVINAEPKFTYLQSADLFIATAHVQLLPTFADDNALGNYLNLLWDYVLISSVAQAKILYQSYITPPLVFQAGDSFKIEAALENVIEGTGTVVSETTHSITIERVA